MDAARSQNLKKLLDAVPAGYLVDAAWLVSQGKTDFTYFKIIRWGWYYLSTILDDYSRYIIVWKLCTNMRAEDVTNTIELALSASGCDQAVVRHKT